LSSPPSILHPTSRQGGQRYEVFDIHKYHLTPPPPCHLSKIKSDLPIKLTPLLSAPPPASPLFRERKGTKFFALSSPFPSHPLSPPPPSEGRQSYELSGICKPPYSQRPIPRSRGAQRYEVFRFVKPPFYSAPLFLKERKGTKMRQLGFAACCG